MTIVFRLSLVLLINNVKCLILSVLIDFPRFKFTLKLLCLPMNKKPQPVVDWVYVAPNNICLYSLWTHILFWSCFLHGLSYCFQSYEFYLSCLIFPHFRLLFQ